MSGRTIADGAGSGPSPHRRGFLQAGLAASALPAVAGVAAWPTAGLAGDASVPVYKVIHDQYEPAAIAFGRAAAAAGHDTYAVHGDLTELWYDLNRRWKEGPIAIAGLTTPAVAMYLEMMGWDAGLRTVFRADHKPLAEGGVQHVAVGPESMLSRASLLDTGAAWGAGTAKLLGACPAARATRSTLTLKGAPESGACLAQPLVSWVVAPVKRA